MAITEPVEIAVVPLESIGDADGNPSLVLLEIGSRGDLTDKRARAAAEAWRRCVARGVPKIILHLTGYDQDPREIWDIPSARDYVNRWAKHAEVTLAEAEKFTTELGVGFLVICWVFGEAREQATRDLFNSKSG